MNDPRRPPDRGGRRGPGQMILVVLAIAVTALVAARLLPLLIRGVRALFVLLFLQLGATRAAPALAAVVVLGAVGLYLVLRRRRRRPPPPKNDASN